MLLLNPFSQRKKSVKEFNLRITLYGIFLMRKGDYSFVKT